MIHVYLIFRNIYFLFRTSNERSLSKLVCEILTTMMTFEIAFLQRFGPLLKALWINIDVGLDFRQALVYKEYAFEENGTYHQWAINNTDPSNNYTQTVSHAYFQTSCAIFFLPPLIILTDLNHETLLHSSN